MDDRRPSEEHDEITYADTHGRQNEFEELVREEEREGDLDEKAFQDAVDRDRAGERPEDTPPSSTMP
jgi:hypothetical protein